jgi:hypothetical protein
MEEAKMIFLQKFSGATRLDINDQGNKSHQVRNNFSKLLCVIKDFVNKWKRILCVTRKCGFA